MTEARERWLLDTIGEAVQVRAAKASAKDAGDLLSTWIAARAVYDARSARRHAWRRVTEMFRRRVR